MFTVKNFSRYFADELGNIYSLNYKKTGKIKILKPAISTDGYLKTVLLTDSKEYQTIAVHRWVAEAYFGPKLSWQEVNHINGIKADNRKENLEYCSRSQNMKHAFDNGLAKGMKGSANPFSKLNEQDVLNIREQAKKGRFYGRKQLAEKYGICESHVKAIVSGRRGVWNHI